MDHLTWVHRSDWRQKGADFDRLINPGMAAIDMIFFSGDRRSWIAVAAMSESKVQRPWDLAYALSRSYARRPIAASTGIVS
jgi:hypothetical protein